MGLKKYTDKQIISNAKKYKSKIDWKNKSPNLYSAAVRRNLIKNATIHMTRPPSHKIKWIKEIVLKDAKKYNSKSEWMKNSNSSYNSAKKNGWFTKATSHMDRPDMTRKWTKQTVIKNAKKFKTIKEWTNSFSGAYDAAFNKGWLKEATAHMIRPAWKGLRIWTKEKILDDAKKFKHRVRWSEKSGGAYAAAQRMGILKLATKHMIRPSTKGVNLGRRSPAKWTDELLKNSASKYETVKEWRTKEESAYATASARGLLKELTKRMIKIGEKGYWTKEKVKQSALKYKTKVEWITNEPAAYRACLKNSWIDELTNHMTPIGNKKMRCVYSISVVGKKIIYIGLTGYFERRMRDHFETKRIIKLIKEYGKNSIITKQLTKYILADEAIKIEDKLINHYRKKKYIVLNRAKAGSLGGTTIKWTKEKILIEAKKYQTIKDWLKKDKLSYSAAWSMNILNQATKHMTRLWEKKWTDEKVIKAALKFKSFKKWAEKDKKSYAAAIRRKLLNDPRITNHLEKIMGKASKWSMVKAIKEAKKYNYRSVWKKNSPSSYRYAHKNGFFLKAVKHMKRPKPWNKINKMPTHGRPN